MKIAGRKEKGVGKVDGTRDVSSLVHRRILHVFGDNNGINYMDDTVAGFDVGFDDSGVIHHWIAAAHTNRETFAINSFGWTHF